MFEWISYIIIYFATWTLSSNFAYIVGQSLFFAFMLSLILSASSIVFLHRLGQKEGATNDSRITGWKLTTVLVIGVLAAVFISLIATRPDPDDSVYLNRAAVLSQAPLDPIPQYYSMFPEEDQVPFRYPTYPLIAYHDLVGLVSWLTNSEPPVVTAFIFTPFMAAMIVLAYAVLFRTLAPDYLIWLIPAFIFFMAIDGTSHWFVSNFGFVRIWQGKAVMLNVLMPLALAYGIRIGLHMRRYDLFVMTAIQVTMVSVSSVGIWFGPVVGGMGIVTGILLASPKPIDGLRRLFLSGLTFTYPLLVGIVSYISTRNKLSFQEARNVNFSWITQRYFSDLETLYIWIVLLLLVIVVVRLRTVRVYLLVTTLITFLFFANPIVAGPVSRYITSTVVYWRVFWLFPIPVVAAFAILLPLWLIPERIKIIKPLAVIAVAIVFGILVPQKYLLEPDNKVVLGYPTVKVEANAYSFSQEIIEAVPANSLIIAPKGISWIIPMFRKPVFPLVPRTNVISGTVIQGYMTEEEANLREYVTDYVQTGNDYDEEQWQEVLATFDVSAIVTASKVNNPEFYALLESKGYQRYESYGYAYWVKSE